MTAASRASATSTARSTARLPVLVTGCSSGIGRASVVALTQSGRFTVYATARRPDSIADLERTGARILPLDVTDEQSMIAAVDAVTAEHGAVWGLVNNAGYGEYGSVEEADLDRVRTMFETNVFGLSRLTQLVLPGMRAQRSGRIVNVGSMGGRMTFPGGGYYHASKYAVEALSDALRYEVRPFGLSVSLIEPGVIRTEFGNTATTSLAKSSGTAGPYAELTRAVDARINGSYQSRLMSAPPETGRLGGDAGADLSTSALPLPGDSGRQGVGHHAPLLLRPRLDGILRLQFR